MKFKVTMKTPYALEAAIDSIDKKDIPLDEIDDFVDAIKQQCKKWFEYGEYITLEIDTDANTCIVLSKE